MIVIAIGCHWVACTWGLQASFAPLQSWYSVPMVGDELAYCVPWAEGVSEAKALEMLATACPENRQCDIGVCDTGVCLGGSSCARPGELYTMALYYAICSVSGVGTMIAKPYNTAEQILAGVIHLLTGMLWAYLIGVFTSL
jgi:hypothetical protein